MADSSVESSEGEKSGRLLIEVASHVAASPDHPEYTADRAYTSEIAGGRSGVIAIMDGVGSGGAQSAKAAEFVQSQIRKESPFIIKMPTINQAAATLKKAIFAARDEIQALQQARGNENIDTTVSAAILCESPDRQRRFMVIANVGDSRIYKYSPSTGTLEQITKDDSLVQGLVDQGQITPEEAFSHPRRNIVTKTVGSLSDPNDVGIGVFQVKDGDIFIAVSDGISDNITPHGLPFAVRNEFAASYDSIKKQADLKKFAQRIIQRAENIMSSSSASQAKHDDASVAVLRTRRV
ncbi:serine/threonine-protein phosphatase [Candidatus Curtissbacteria bacterium]|nr:serine/threonine-protein phosphatase [Candidatus Curtissbacteria bacterium]